MRAPTIDLTFATRSAEWKRPHSADPTPVPFFRGLLIGLPLGIACWAALAYAIAALV